MEPLVNSDLSPHQGSLSPQMTRLPEVVTPSALVIHEGPGGVRVICRSQGGNDCHLLGLAADT